MLSDGYIHYERVSFTISMSPLYPILSTGNVSSEYTPPGTSLWVQHGQLNSFYASIWTLMTLIIHCKLVLSVGQPKNRFNLIYLGPSYQVWRTQQLVWQVLSWLVRLSVQEMCTHGRRFTLPYLKWGLCTLALKDILFAELDDCTLRSNQDPHRPLTSNDVYPR